jgi:hypothetical protein
LNKIQFFEELLGATTTRFDLAQRSHQVASGHPLKKRSIFVKKMKIEINAWEDSLCFALS